MISRTCKTAVLVSSALCGPAALASSFALIDQNVSGLGVAFAGAGVAVDDPSTIFFNPAGLTRLERPAVSISTVAGDVSTSFRNSNSQPAALQPLGSNGGDAGVFKVLPAAYASLPLGDKLALGVAVNAPFGLTTNYSGDSLTRFQAVTSEIKTRNVQLAVAYQLDPAVSFGVGIDFQRIDAKLSAAIDYSAVIASVLQPFVAAGQAPPQLLAANAGLQGDTRFRGNDEGIGFDLGVMIDVTKSTRVGAAYRSSIDYTIEGSARVTPPSFPEPTGAAIAAAAAQIVPGLATASTKADLKVPGSARIAGLQQLTDKLNLLASVEFTDWSTVQELRLIQRADGQTVQVIPTRWHDTWRYSLGAAYTVSERLTLRAGAAFDESPVPDSTRESRIPDGDRTIVSVGARLKPLDSVSVDLGYSHLFVDDGRIQSDRGGMGALFGAVRGTQKNEADVYGLQVTVGF